MKQIKLFGTDGIRGVAGAYPLDTDTIRKIGVAAATVLGENTAQPLIIIGRDTRQSGADIARQLAAELSSAGIAVWDLGVIPTPGVAYLAKRHPVLAGVVISASHNPYQDNGIKFFGPEGTKLSDALEEKIENVIISALPAKKRTGVPGSVSAREGMVAQYADFLKAAFPSGRDLKGMRIVIDCANGATSAVAGGVLSALGATIVETNVAPNGTNINRDCGSLHPEKLAAEVVKHAASCGLAFDGDGDRMICIDDTGEVRDGDYLLAIAASHRKRKGTLANDTLVTTVMANLGLFRAMERVGVQVLQTKVGDRYVFEEMVRSNASIGGEQSGHIIFRDFLSTGDGILSALQMLSVLHETGKPLSELCAVMRKYPQVLLNVRVGRKVPVESLPHTSKAIKDRQDKLGSDGRVLVRYSGTENLLRVMIEGQDKDIIANFANEIAEIAENEIGRI